LPSIVNQRLGAKTGATRSGDDGKPFPRLGRRQWIFVDGGEQSRAVVACVQRKRKGGTRLYMATCSMKAPGPCGRRRPAATGAGCHTSKSATIMGVTDKRRSRGTGYRVARLKKMGRWPMGRLGFEFFQYSKSTQISKFNFSILPRSKNVETLHDARSEHGEQLCPLAELKIPNASHVISFGSNSNLNFL
jgi:hypothetical protein